MDLPLARLLPLQAWSPRSMEAEVLEEAIRTSFEPVSLGLAAGLAAVATGHPLADGAGRPYAPDFEALPHLPLLVLAGGGDALVSARDSRAAFERSLSRDKAFRRFGPAAGTPVFGHMDLLLGRHAPRFVWPLVVDWLDRH
jgi:fermentation-respiration switch protein FrsA (DUF1100 family)